MKTVSPPYGDLWKVAVVDCFAEPVTDEQRTELYAWLEGLGVPYRECRPTFVVTQNSEDKRLLLHLSRHELTAGGKKYIDYAVNDVCSTPLVLEITDYPAWLVQASHVQDQTDLSRPRGTAASKGVLSSAY